MKKDYMNIHKLRELSGAGWNDDTKSVSIPEAVWSAYVQVCPIFLPILFILLDKSTETPRYEEVS